MSLLARLAVARGNVAQVVLDLDLEALGFAPRDVAFAGQLALGNHDAVHLLKRAEVADVEPRHERDRGARLPRAPGSPGAVRVDLGGDGRGVGDDVREIADVDA